MIKHVIFDLDGTLTDSKEGIIRSVEYALQKAGETTTHRLSSEIIVGPPLLTTFQETYGFSEKKARAIYAFFQERYSTIGKFENRLFPGIIQLMKALATRHIRSYVATSKPEIHAREICQHFQLLPYLAAIAGPTVGGKETKIDCINRIIRCIGTKQEVVMVGDRKYDIDGAHIVGIQSVAVAYGYGSEREIQACKPDFTAYSVDELAKWLLR
ncbi:haloacid dehalogenase [Veillonellaceae bacterium M2-8]|nr:haloacid dehalogenase [Veillonellaceae bacterium M2-8]